MLRGGDIYGYYTTSHMYTIENAMFLKWPDATTSEDSSSDDLATPTKSKVPLSKKDAAAAAASAES